MTAIARPTPIPAATLILFRDRAGDAPELLFVERSMAMAFAGGALVFPGGRVDPADHVLAATMSQGEAGSDDDDHAARIAAIRETIEEVGIAIGVTAGADVAGLRRALHDGATIGEALGDIGAAIDPGALTPFARWCPDLPHARVFDTRFYLGRLPYDAAIAVADGTENVRAFWASARSVLDDVAAARERVIFPTHRTLERLATYANFADAAADAARHLIRTITPWIEQRGGERFLCIPDDLGFPVTAERVGESVRG